MEWAAIWALVKRWWPFGVIAVLAFVAYNNYNVANQWQSKAELCAQARKTDEANYRKAATEAADKNKATVIATERKWQQVVNEKDKAYSASLASANASVSSYVERLREQTRAYQSSLRSAGVSPVTYPSGSTDGAGEATLVPVSDLSVCAENTVKAQTWQDFWKGVVAAQPQ